MPDTPATFPQPGDRPAVLVTRPQPGADRLAAVLRGQKIPRLQLDQLAHQLYQIARHNDQARSLMVRRAQQQRAHVDQIIEAMKTDGLSE